MGFLSDNCIFCAYTKEVANVSSFSCGQDDMDDFFKVDAFEYATFKMGQSYCFRLTECPNIIVCAFTLSNDSIRIYDLPRSRRDLMLHITRHRKRLNRYPGVLLGRIGVNVNYLHRGIGSETLDFIKEWFSDASARSGCRFIIVDALNTPNVIDFYRKNGFSLLFSTPEQEYRYTNQGGKRADRLTIVPSGATLHTRIMYYDLLNWR